MQTSERRIRRTVGRARGHWYRLGVPRDIRDWLAAGLRAELDDAATQGLPVEFVVGDDLPSFATARAPRDGRRSVVWFLGELALGLLLVPALLALIGVPLYDRPAGFHVHELSFVVMIVLATTWLQAIRDRRGELDRADTVRLGFLGALPLVVVGTVVTEMLRTPARFVEVAPALAWGVIAATLLGQLVVSQHRRVRWRTAFDVSA
jgi:hypothetical protein